MKTNAQIAGDKRARRLLLKPARTQPINHPFKTFHLPKKANDMDIVENERFDWIRKRT